MATQRYRLIALTICVCIVAVSVVAEDVLEAKEGKTALEHKMKAVNDLKRAEDGLKRKISKEKAQKANKAVLYMEKYNAAKNANNAEASRLERKIATDRAGILSTTPHLAKKYERNRKHDKKLKQAMKTALTSVKSVDGLVKHKVKVDPTVKMAEQAVNQAQGSAVYTVLGLDAEQLSKEYLLDLDAAVAAYDADPTNSAHEKLQKAVKKTKEKMKKEELKEYMAKKEKHMKKFRESQNKKYFKVKWMEKRKEMAGKKVRKNKFVKKVKNELRFKGQQRTRLSKEADAKKLKLTKERQNKKNEATAKRKAWEGTAAGKAHLKEQAQKKFAAKHKQLQDKASAAKSDYMKKLRYRKAATVGLSRAKAEQKAAKIGVAAVKKSVAAAKTQLTAATAAAAKVGSATNLRAKANAQKLLDARVAGETKASVKVKMKDAQVKEKTAKLAKSKINEKTALSGSQAAMKAAVAFATKTGLGTKKSKAKAASRRRSSRRRRRRI
jgi:hypothetical protein